jgi:hypothetical protein
MAEARRLVSYFGNRYLDHFERDLEEIRAHGFDTVVHCVTEADVEWGMSRVAEMFAMTKDAGLACWADPWGVAGVFGGEAHARSRAPGAAVREWTDAVAAAGAEWLFWDEPDLGLGPEELVAFLEEAAAHGRTHRLHNSVCLTSRERNVSAIHALAALDSIDDVGTDPYYERALGDLDPAPEDYVGAWADHVTEAAAAQGKTSHVWVQAFDVAGGNEQRIAQCLEVAHRHGADRIGVWGFRACEALDIRPDRPELAWRVVGEALRRL